MSARREEQAYNDGRLAFAHGHDATACARRSPEQRAAWLRGWEAERAQRRVREATPEEIEASRERVRKLKEWAQTL